MYFNRDVVKGVLKFNWMGSGAGATYENHLSGVIKNIGAFMSRVEVHIFRRHIVANVKPLHSIEAKYIGVLKEELSIKTKRRRYTIEYFLMQRLNLSNVYLDLASNR